MTTGRQIMILFAIFVVSSLYCFSLFGGYEGIGDGGDYAALARNLIAGEGFSLGHVYPLALAFDTHIPQPNNIWAPGYPLYLAAWFALLRPSDWVAVSAAAFAIWLLILASYLLGRQVAGEKIGLLTAAFVGLSQVVFYAAIEGTPEILCGAFLTFSVVILIENQNPKRAAISGALFGLAFLTRYQIAIVVIPLVVFFIGKRPREIAAWAVSTVLVASPWLARNWIVFGNPLFTLQAYGEFTKGMGRFGDYYFTYRSFEPVSFTSALLNFPLDLAKKFIGGLIFFAGAFPIRFNFLGAIPFFFALIKIEKTDGLQRKLLFFAFSSSVLVILLSSLDGHHDRHLLPLQGFLALAMFLGGVLLIRELGLNKYRAAVIAGAAILFLPMRSPFQEMRLSMVADECRMHKIAYDSISRLVGSREIVVSDASDAVWWYSNRMSIWLPVEYADLKALMSRENCRYLYLSRPIEFLNSLSEEDLIDFGISAEPDQTFPGPGQLYLFNGGGSRPDEFAM